MIGPKFEEFKEIVGRFKVVTLENLYDIIDKINNNLAPNRNNTYYRKYGRWISKLEAMEIIEPMQYEQTWRVIKNYNSINGVINGN